MLLALFERQMGQRYPVPHWAFGLGILLFSGSLYLLALTGTRWLGAITPIGGTAFLIGWLAFAWYGYQSSR